MTDIATSTIVQQAFREMELSPPSSFGDESEQALAAEEQYPEAMKLCLEAADWSFASVFAFLSESDLPTGSYSDPDLPHFYLLPGDLVKMREICNPPNSVRFRRDRDGLRSEAAAPLRLRYTGMVEDETQLPASFKLAVALRLAVLLAPRWVGTASKTDRLMQAHMMQLKKAQREDSRTASDVRYDDQPLSGDWAGTSTL
jgi:hypothetical protein